MDITERREAGITILRPVGRIDMSVSAEFQAHLLAAVTAEGSGCIVDFSAIPYISSAGLRAIMAAARAKPADRQFVVAALGPVVEEIFRVARFHHIVRIFATVEEAQAGLSGAS